MFEDTSLNYLMTFRDDELVEGHLVALFWIMVLLHETNLRSEQSLTLFNSSLRDPMLKELFKERQQSPHFFPLILNYVVSKAHVQEGSFNTLQPLYFTRFRGELQGDENGKYT